VVGNHLWRRLPRDRQSSRSNCKFTRVCINILKPLHVINNYSPIQPKWRILWLPESNIIINGTWRWLPGLKRKIRSYRAKVADESVTLI